MDTVAVLDFGGQYAHLIANRIRRLGVYSEILPSDVHKEKALAYKGLILSGSPFSVTDNNRPGFNNDVLSLSVPILGLCYGHQLMAQVLGGTIHRSKEREYGCATLEIAAGDDPFFKGLDKKEIVWMSHGDSVERVPQGFDVLASTATCPVAAMGNADHTRYGLQFHPEVTDTPPGMKILDNFLTICGCQREWSSRRFLEQIGDNIKHRCAGKKVFLLVSGGVDSTVAFTLLNNVLGPDRVVGLHVDTGLMRQGESGDILKFLRAQGFENLNIIDASEKFIHALHGQADPEAKRKIIGEMFLTVSAQAQEKMGLTTGDWLLGQGTIYPDTIESAGTKHADKIKTHHNRVDGVLALIEQGKIIEPLAQLYKDEVRLAGKALGISDKLLNRHPFPGPGLGVRILCSDKKTETIDLEINKAVQKIAAGFGYGACALPIRSVGVQGDSRTYAHPAVVFGARDWKTLEALSTAITNGVRGINRVVYCLTSSEMKPYRLQEAYLTKERIARLQAIDHLVTETLYARAEYDQVWQMPVVLLPLVNDAGNECVVLRPISSQEAMTARFKPLGDATLGDILFGAAKIDKIGELFFDITHKPPGTIEWE